MIGIGQDFMLRLREAFEASWDKDTSFMSVEKAGNRALGQCYPTARVVQHFYPETRIIKGTVRTDGQRDDIHFWNALSVGDHWYHIDMSWQQFGIGAKVIDFVVLNADDLKDSDATTRRVELLLNRVKAYLAQRD